MNNQTKPNIKVVGYLDEEVMSMKSDAERPKQISLRGNIVDVAELEEEIKDDVLCILEEYEYDNVCIVGTRIIGSYIRGEQTDDSDLDVLVEYKGGAREDDLFDLINDEENKIYIYGVEVDVNPITEEKSGTIAQFEARNAGFSKRNERT